MENFIYDYFIRPIWEHSGYNMVNTLAYAAIAVFAVWFLHDRLKKIVRFDERFIAHVLCFVLFGSTARVVTDSIDSGIFKPVTPIHALVLESHIWDYGYLTVTPGIYIVTAALLLASIAILHKIKRLELLGYVGLVLWLPHFLLLIPFMTYAIYAIPIILLALIPTVLTYIYIKDKALVAIVAGQALDGAATFFVIDVFSKISGISYFEQHVISSAIGGLFGTFFTFYLLKVGIAIAAAVILSKEKQAVEIFSVFGRAVSMDKYYIALVLMIIGFAPGIRDVLRMVVGS